MFKSPKKPQQPNTPITADPEAELPQNNRGGVAGFASTLMTGPRGLADKASRGVKTLMGS